ncbi:MAG: GNAT family N-acetyltransferase [Clostridia bacterium]|nr:GNAT family N-acetyltransferase [Clostridia bacterium]
MKEFEVLRADSEWQRAGAYSVRIQGMNRQYHISLREEFDEHDGDQSKYIVLLDDGYPVATCRFYELDCEKVMIGRVVVLPEYRGQKLGTKVMQEAESWITDLGYKTARIESRIQAVDFYRKLGYSTVDGIKIQNGTFECIRMEKILKQQ